ncbi:MAG TPA: 30S ribosomal protein S6--L-glutamate ligase, partial [Arenimonas sp.]|nr:30S ribosomal protein S6--L-glutamate ligase [Arenimonas sp.]
KASAVDLSEAEIETALAAARVVGLEVAGVDLLRSSRGPLVLEVNSSPGLEGIEAATGADVAGAVVDLLVERRPPTPRRRAGRPPRLTKA